MLDISHEIASKKILVVEDEVDVLSYYTHVLGDRYEVITARSGNNALEFIDSSRCFDLAIVDYRLPDISGIEVLKIIKKSRPGTSVILVTAYGDEDVAVNAFRSGAVDYMKKPVSYGELQKKVKLYVNTQTDSRNDQREFMYAEDNVKTRMAPNQAGDPNYYKIQKAIKYIHGTYALNATLIGAADSACLSKYYFSKIFKKITGQTYQDYLNELRMQKAKELLSQNILNITEIAHYVGYADITHFERIFKRIVGCTPSKYRSAHRPLPY